MDAVFQRPDHESFHARQPFNFGFTDHTHRYVVTGIKTEDMRYILNTALFDCRLDTHLPRFQLDTAAMRRLALTMHQPHDDL